MPVALPVPARHLIDALASVFLPGRCAACRLPCGAARFCPACDAALAGLEQRPTCADCGAPLAEIDLPCQRCRGRGYRLFDTVVNLGVYAGPLRPLVHRLKFYHSWTTAELLADRAARLGRVRDLLRHTDVLVPVPLHGWRQVSRGFNQADVIAKRLGWRAGVRVRRPVIRLRATRPQSLLTSRLDRLRNLSGAFAVPDPRPLAGRRVTLVDDVMTTGATLKAMARAVAGARPASINVFTLALADPTGHEFEAT